MPSSCGDGSEPNLICYLDGDEDGYAAEAASTMLVCGDHCGDGWTARRPEPGAGDCDDDDALAHVDASERCNDLDDDCDSAIDEAASSSCSLDHASAACVGGKCVIVSCESGYGDCESAAAGCEQALNVAEHCGDCGVVCPSLASCEDRDGVAGCQCVVPAFAQPGASDLACTGPGPLTVGESFMCAIGASRTVTCNGLQDPPANLQFARISSALVGKSACGVTSDGAIVCWPAGSPPAGSDYMSVSVASNICGILRANGEAVCTGDATATQPSAGTAYRQIVAGLLHSCALREDGGVSCFGSGKSADQDGCAVDYECGQSLPPLDSFVQIAAGYLHTCGLRATGSVACWGAGEAPTQGTFPEWGQAHPPSEPMRWITAAGNTTCGIRAADNTIACWGQPYLDNGTTVSPPLGEYERVVAGVNMACALRREGDVSCWGDRGPAGNAVPMHIEGPFPLEP